MKYKDKKEILTVKTMGVTISETIKKKIWEQIYSFGIDLKCERQKIALSKYS